MDIEKLDLKSPDLVNENFEKLAALFPNCVTEGAEGKAIDFDLLKQELSHAVVEGNKERYRLEWPGKREAIVTANLPTTKTLRPVREDSVDFDNTENLYIEGDNLEVLKLLQESYLGKIKMIYIDPPYNTGKDFVYKDNFSKDAQEELIESGQKDEYNQRLVANPETAGRYHSDWLSMMYPRLKLARNLLSNDGVIFISIDDNEVHNLKRVCDEIFGDINFIANVIWERAFAPKNDAKYFSDSHDHILVFTKNILEFEIGKLERSEESKSRYKNADDDSRGPWTSGDLSVKTYSEKYDYPITTPSGRTVNPPHGSCWRVSKEKFQELVNDNRIWFGKDGNNVPRLKRFLSEVQTGMVPISIWPYKEVGHNQEGRQEVKKLFDDKGYFDGPKPVRLLSRILQVANLDEDSTVLDFFSGSGSLAHTVYSWNAENQGRVSFIQVQLPEETDEKSEAYKAGFKNICEIGKERIRRAANKIKEETKADIDYGFRVYRLDSSNMQDVYYKPQDYNQSNLDLFADNVKPDRTADDLLAQVMLDWGLPLSLKIEQVDVSGKKAFKVAENSLYACFDSGIDEDFAKAIAQDEPLRIVFKDSGFKNDTAKTNVKQLLKQLSPETEMKVI
ncbi:site-specific DNA-methyltransferase [Marinoscillum sp. MHG1-6]|uniref:site-specific DNA-methyltransferase n=1 Tax=Marinoscillum sp. MHG1-6 TaxID=2959627 RepID=UPI00215858C1|nr:site-specific DNA-methyltransferase [Marinoscillum sp. MHG1-6]